MKNIIELKIGDVVIKGETPLSRGKTICLMNQVITDLHEIGIDAAATAIPVKEKTVMVFVSPKTDFEPVFASGPESKMEELAASLAGGEAIFWYPYTEDEFTKHTIPELMRDFKRKFVIMQTAG